MLARSHLVVSNWVAFLNKGLCSHEKNHFGRQIRVVVRNIKKRKEKKSGKEKQKKKERKEKRKRRKSME
jgi:hypothetical protein